MALKQQFELLALYNQWMNGKIYEAAARLGPEEAAKDRGAFFGSIQGTLNHLVVGDTIWLQRFATRPSCGVALEAVAKLATPASPDEILFPTLYALAEHRSWLDDQIRHWVAGLTHRDLESVFHYRNTKGVPTSKRYASLILHFFNHQTHHRGQVCTLLFQAGVDPGLTDLLALIPDEADT